MAGISKFRKEKIGTGNGSEILGGQDRVVSLVNLIVR
jgi:hypothetical protein